MIGTCPTGSTDGTSGRTLVIDIIGADIPSLRVVSLGAGMSLQRAGSDSKGDCGQGKAKIPSSEVKFSVLLGHGGLLRKVPVDQSHP